MKKPVPEPINTNTEFDFWSKALWFCVPGFFICGATAGIILMIQMQIEKIALDCVQAMIYTWQIMITCCLIVPILFYVLLRRKSVHNSSTLKKQYVAFNLAMYVFLQASLCAIDSDPERLCYAADGQNGMELIFNGWLSLPVILLLGKVLNKLEVKVASS